MKQVIPTETPIRVIGDVHGSYDEFAMLVHSAKAEGRTVVQLGDLEDRGPDPASCIDLAMRECIVLMSNHGWKHFRGYDGRPVMFHEEHKKTRSNMNKRGADWLHRYLEFMREVPWFVTYGNNFFAHASYHSYAERDDLSNKQRKTLESALIYGMVDPKNVVGGLPNRLLDWFDHIPVDKRVFIGHHILSTQEILKFQTTGGEAYFIDLGCQSREGGQLAYVDFDNGEIVGSSHAIVAKDDPGSYGGYHTAGDGADS